MTNKKLFHCFSLTRRFTYYLHAVALILGLFGFIFYITLANNIPFEWYVYALAGVGVAAVYLMIDYHFIDVV